MTTATVSPGPAARTGAAPATGTDHPRHFLGSALHAIRVFTVAAAEVVLLGSGRTRY